MKELICIKKCVSDKYHITNIGDCVLLYNEEIEERVYDHYLNSYFDLDNRWNNGRNCYKNENNFELHDKVTGKTLGFFDIRNFLTLAELREQRINKILND